MADEDEPVAYLGGAAGEPPPPKDEDVSGYLGGNEGELPALPPQESTGSYTANDFIKPEEQPADDPYADPYAQPPTEEPADQYGEYDAGQGGDASYFDSMAHSGEAPAEEAPAADQGYADDYNDDPDQPKTISQQDAESIIRRITTKRILPPEQEGKRPQIAPPRLTEAGGGMRIWPIIFVVLVLGGVGVYLFGEQIADTFPGLREYMPWLEPKVEQKPVELVQVEDPAVTAKRELLEMITKSEAKAFGVKPADVPPLKKTPAPGTGPPGAPPTDSERK